MIGSSTQTSATKTFKRPQLQAGVSDETTRNENEWRHFFSKQFSLQHLSLKVISYSLLTSLAQNYTIQIYELLDFIDLHAFQALCTLVFENPSKFFAEDHQVT